MNFGNFYKKINVGAQGEFVAQKIKVCKKASSFEGGLVEKVTGEKNG